MVVEGSEAKQMINQELSDLNSKKQYTCAIKGQKLQPAREEMVPMSETATKTANNNDDLLFKNILKVFGVVIVVGLIIPVLFIFAPGTAKATLLVGVIAGIILLITKTSNTEPSIVLNDGSRKAAVVDDKGFNSDQSIDPMTLSTTVFYPSNEDD